MTVQELIDILKDADPDATVSIKYSVEDSDEDSGYRDEFVALDEPQIDFVGDEEHLNLLYLLTVADISATNENVWNSWKDNIFRQLYTSTKMALSNEGDDLAHGRHTPQVVQHEFDQHQPEGEQADDAQVLVMQPHAQQHLGKSSHCQR